MLSLVLASWLSTQQWSWDKVEPTPDASVQGYRIYWNVPGWCPRTGVVEVPTSQCDATTCWGDTPEPAEPLVFFEVVAYNGAGETTTEHPEVMPVCP